MQMDKRRRRRNPYEQEGGVHIVALPFTFKKYHPKAKDKL